ncbi:helix-turn-helix transcriptional regulator [Bacillus toyonensis]|uniref:helix-turn-helix transcriptional regulator n=1 Tax=Bacillus toyonensis TaxID=155322 RepID=UPI000BFE6574|nr:helix-turn-helix transcriptional regulator [Bacillus toyonensis]PHG67351.1 transcriptional regulator [Bacillus toyonensis]
MKNKIKELRKLQKFSQDDLAKICNVTRQTINAIENNKYDPSLNLAFCIAVSLKTDINQVFIYSK